MKKLKHLGIILDGNRRWAKEKGRPIFAGYRAGAITLKKTITWCRELGVDYLTAFVFSSENWNRPSREVQYLMDLANKFFSRELNWVNKEGIVIRVSGDLKRFSEDSQCRIKEVENKTKDNPGPVLNLALGYGGRDEIVEAVKRIIDKKDLDQIDQKKISQHLWTAGLPDPDLIIRTGGEQRLSGFLLWQAAYAELYFLKKYWPDFDRDDLKAALDDYSRRQRRFGR